MRITVAPPATATRDLASLVSLGALLRTGEIKATRYSLNIDSQKPRQIEASHFEDLITQELPAAFSDLAGVGVIRSYRGSIRPIEITHTKIHLKISNKIDVYAIFM